MSKNVILSIGIFVWVVTPIIISNLFALNLIEILKSFFSFIHILAIGSVLLINHQTKHKIQKAFITTAFFVYPLLLNAENTDIFEDYSFVVVSITAWLYIMGYIGWLYTEKKP
ncbi:hypothetical protein [Aquiflexum sp.]|uniref:hypothetical protein n=1 Tax=Aquiflexum sp. TaxID=1872584 RepID=UPI0035940830